MLYFDWNYYINRYADLRKAGINNNTSALNHWINFGIKESRICNKIFENFDWKDYLSKHPEFKNKNDVLLNYFKENCKISIKINKEDTLLLDKIKQMTLNYNYFNVTQELNQLNFINTSLPIQPKMKLSSNISNKKQKYQDINNVKIIICSCVYKRFELSKFCINEWLKLNVYKVIIAYSFDEDFDNLKDIISKYNDRLVLVKFPNLPLSDKWNHSVYTAKQYKPDAIMIIGSDDIFTNSYLNKVKYHINQGTDYISNNNWANIWYFSNKVLISTERYIHRSYNDGIGSGRVINSSILNKIDWNLYKFDKPINKRLDCNSYNKIHNFIISKIYDIDDIAILLLKLAGDDVAITVKDNLIEYIEKSYRTNSFNKTIDNVYCLNYN